MKVDHENRYNMIVSSNDDDEIAVLDKMNMMESDDDICYAYDDIQEQGDFGGRGEGPVDEYYHYQSLKIALEMYHTMTELLITRGSTSYDDNMLVDLNDKLKEMTGKLEERLGSGFADIWNSILINQSNIIELVMSDEQQISFLVSS